MVTLIDRKSKTSIFSISSMDSKIGPYGTVSEDKNTKSDVQNVFLNINNYLKSPFMSVFKLS